MAVQVEFDGSGMGNMAINATFDSNNKVVVVYEDDDNNYGTAVVGTVGSISFDNCISFGSINFGDVLTRVIIKLVISYQMCDCI